MEIIGAQPWARLRWMILLNCQAYMELQPRYRTLPARTKPSNVSNVSSMGVVGSHLESW